MVNRQYPAGTEQLDYTIERKTAARTEANDAGDLLLAALGAEHERLFLYQTVDLITFGAYAANTVYVNRDLS